MWLVLQSYADQYINNGNFKFENFDVVVAACIMVLFFETTVVHLYTFVYTCCNVTEDANRSRQSFFTYVEFCFIFYEKV